MQRNEKQHNSLYRDKMSQDRWKNRSQRSPGYIRLNLRAKTSLSIEDKERKLQARDVTEELNEKDAENLKNKTDRKFLTKVLKTTGLKTLVKKNGDWAPIFMYGTSYFNLISQTANIIFTRGYS